MVAGIPRVTVEFPAMAADHLNAEIFRVWGATVSMQKAPLHSGFVLRIRNNDFVHPLYVAESGRCRVHLHHGERYSKLEVAYPTAKAPEEALRSALFVSQTLSELLTA